MSDEQENEFKEEVRNLEALWHFEESERDPNDKCTGDFLVTLYLQRFIPFWFQVIGWIALLSALIVVKNKTDSAYVSAAATVTHVMLFFAVASISGRGSAKLVRTIFGPFRQDDRSFRWLKWGSIFVTALLWIFVVGPGISSIVEAFTVESTQQ